MADNTLAFYSVSLAVGKEVKLIRKISLHGHRSNVRVLAFSSDNLAIFTGGSESVKMWNKKTLNCIRTVETSSAVQCLCVLPGDRHILAGLEDGKLLVIDIAAGDIIESISAHLKDLKSIYMLPDEVKIKLIFIFYYSDTIFFDNHYSWVVLRVVVTVQLNYGNWN
jgi:U3 small nucleolar RNA-associated protein 12